ncbi:MAG: metallophosphoesterase [Pirellulales bacterium]
MALILLALGAVGHMVLWVALINRVHAIGIRRRWVNLMTIAFVAALAFAPLAVAAALYAQRRSPDEAPRVTTIAAWSYVLGCVVVCTIGTLQRLGWWLHPERSSVLLSNHTSPILLHNQRHRMARRGLPTLLCRLPGNQVLSLHVQRKELTIPRLLPPHDGLRIAHITDLHMSGRLTPAFFEQVAEIVNETDPDLIAITGDIVEGDAFIEWLPGTLGRLRSRHGVFYVLGNHDRRATESTIKRVLADYGLIHVGHDCRRITIHDEPLLIGGNELPWYKPAADFTKTSRNSDVWTPRILLAHSPDQFHWAQEQDIDLMMAGHLHGGQIRFPLMGAITSPSRHGVRYAAGVFRAGNTVMHVSRGVGALTPLRVNCPPEIAILTLRSPTKS